MSRWVAITVDDLKAAKVAALVDACRTAALGGGQVDPMAEVISNVVYRIRAEIKGCRRNTLDADETHIPRDLRSLACRMVMRELQSRLQYALGDDEKEEQRNDLRYLERISKCEVPVALPDTALASEEVQSAGGVQGICKDGAKTSAERMRGL